MKIASSELKDLKRTATGGGIVSLNNGIARLEGVASNSYVTLSKDINVKAGDVLKFRMLARKVDGAGAFNMAFSYPTLSTAVNQIEITETDFRWYELSFVVPFTHNTETQYLHANAGFWTGRIGKAEIAAFEILTENQSYPTARIWKAAEVVIAPNASSIYFDESYMTVGLQNSDIIISSPTSKYFNINVGKIPYGRFGSNPLIFSSPSAGYPFISLRVAGYSHSTGNIKVELLSFAEDTGKTQPIPLNSINGQYRFNFMMLI